MLVKLVSCPQVAWTQPNPGKEPGVAASLSSALASRKMTDNLNRLPPDLLSSNRNNHFCFMLRFLGKLASTKFHRSWESCWCLEFLGLASFTFAATVTLGPVL